MSQFNPPAQSGPQDSLFPGFPTLDVARLISGFVKRIWLIGAATFACILLAAIYLLFAPKTYRSTAVFFLKSTKETNQIALNSGVTFTSLDAMKSMAEGLVSPKVILRVAEKNNLKAEKDLFKKSDEVTNDDIVELLSERVSSNLRKGTRNIEVSVEDRNPARAQRLAASFVSEFEELMLEQSASSSRKSLDILEREAMAQLERVHEAEARLQQFRRENPETNFSNSGGHPEEILADMNKQLTSARNDTLHAKAELEQVNALAQEDPQKILELPGYSKQDNIAKLILARDTKRAEFYRIRAQYEPRHPTYRDYERELAGLEEQLRQQGLVVGETIRKKYQTAVEHEAKLKESLKKERQDLLNVDEKRVEFRTLKWAADAARATHEKILAEMNNKGVTVAESQINMFEDPRVPSKPIKPNKPVVLVLAAFFGLFLGTSIVLALLLLDRSLRTRKQVESTLGISVLAEVPLAHHQNWSLAESLYVAHDPNSIVAESFRALRTSLSSLGPRSVMLTSASPDEGKSFCAINLALLQAQQGYKTLLVDADLRRPSLAGALMPPAMNQGGGNALAQQNVCQPTPYQNLSLITCGRFVNANNEAMTGEHFAAMLWEAYRAFDCVIIDSSPLGVVSDALSYAGYADAVAVIVRSGKTQASDAQRVCEELRRMRAPLAGCILNGVSEVNRLQSTYFEDYQKHQPSAPQITYQNS